MKIAAANLSLDSHRLALTHREQSESLRAWRGEQRPAFEGGRGQQPSAEPAVRVQLSDAARARLAPPPALPEGKGAEDVAAQDATESDPLLMLVKSMVEMLTGRTIKVFSPAEFSRQAASVDAPAPAPDGATAAAPARRAGFGLEYDFHALHEEAEITTFSASGTIRTADGAEIAFRLDLTMQRYYREETSLSLRAGDAVRKDPLVINFGGSAAQLTEQRFRFDLDGDGSAEDIPLLASGSGYLALDRNGNGRIDTGSELFGPATHSGFGELARHDSDGNGWIDEGDRVFDRLRIWLPAADGGGRLLSLKEAGVGALALAHVASPFELRGSGNADLGAVRASGLWLGDDGQAGSLQEIDLTV